MLVNYELNAVLKRVDRFNQLTVPRVHEYLVVVAATAAYHRQLAPYAENM